MRVLVTGANGMLGKDLIAVLEDGYEVIPLDLEGLDITDREATHYTIFSLRPDIVVNCAAYTNVDMAEDEKETAFRVNGLGVQNLAITCNELKIRLCHISTDYVFDGTSTRPYTPLDNTSAVNAYGETKLAGERYIQWLMHEFYIIRTSWLYGEHGNNFIRTMLRLSGERDEIKVVSDQKGSPTWTVTLSEGIRKVIESEVFGIHHITDRTAGGINWYELAAEIIRLSGASVKVIPISTDEYPTRAKRPSYSVLDTFHTEVSTGFSPPDWKTSLEKFIHTLKNQSDVSSS
ncbi:MAG TPA: dTDP-4-dehydrorhamnose reductase [Nitrospirae bacterium]|nr:dTDP-4-dehydrorhamnose reductase [Nitrospirota bacterium]